MSYLKNLKLIWYYVKLSIKRKRPIWYLKNLNDLSDTNVKHKWPIWYWKNLKDLSNINAWFKWHINAFCHSVLS
jgi:hypothetical protein